MKFLKPLALLLFFQFSLSACASLFIREVEKPHFYQATKDQKKFYILGTFHAFVSVHEMPDYVTAPIKTSEIFLMESLPAGENSHPALAMRIHLNSGIVRSELAEKDWKLFKEVFDEVYSKKSKNNRKRSVNTVNYLLANAIVDAYIDEVGKDIAADIRSGRIEIKYQFMDEFFKLKQSLHDGSRLDYDLLKIAKQNDRIVDYLDRDLDILFDLDEKLHKARLLKRLELIRKIQKDPNELILEAYRSVREMAHFADLYRTGKPIGVDPNSDFYLGEEVAGKLFGDRNKIWVEHLEKIEKGYQSGYIAIGAGHLYGRDNFLNLLKIRGYKIQRVTEQN